MTCAFSTPSKKRDYIKVNHVCNIKQGALIIFYSNLGIVKLLTNNCFGVKDIPGTGDCRFIFI